MAAMIQRDVNDRDTNKSKLSISDNNSAGRVFPKDSSSDLDNNILRTFRPTFLRYIHESKLITANNYDPKIRNYGHVQGNPLRKISGS